jgi:hypothetical protein
VHHQKKTTINWLHAIIATLAAFSFIGTAPLIAINATGSRVIFSSSDKLSSYGIDLRSKPRMIFISYIDLKAPPALGGAALP